MVATVRAGGGLTGHCVGYESEARYGPGSVAGALKTAVGDDLGRDRD